MASARQAIQVRAISALNREDTRCAPCQLSAQQAGTDAPINFLLAESRSRLTRSISVVTCSSGSTGRSSSIRPASTIESFISKMREAEKLKEADRISSASSLPYLQGTPDRELSGKPEKLLKVDKLKDIDRKSSDCSLPYLCNERDKSDSSTNMSAKSKSRTSSWNYGLVDLHTGNEGLFSDELSRDLSKGSSSCATDGLVCLGTESSGASRSIVSPDIEIITDKLQSELLENSSPSASKIDRMSSKLSRASSIQSEDSITQELNHFKPINVCPVTPPRKLASGKVIEPPFIRTTPRNLNKTSFSSPTSNEMSLSDLDACSPIMQRRLSELEEERKSNVRRLSKSTLTVKRYDEDGTNENNSAIPGFSDSKNNSAKVEHVQKVYKRKAMDMEELDMKTLSDEASTERKLMIPLESNIDDSMDFDIPPPLSENNNIINVDSDSRSSSGSALMRKKQKRIGKLKQEDNVSQKHIRKKGLSEEKQRCDSFSPQRSITDWVVKGDKSCRSSGQSPSFFTETLQATCLGRDEVDGDFNSNAKAKKSQARTIDHFMTKVGEESKKSVPGYSKRTRKTNQNSAYVWPDYSPKKRDAEKSSKLNVSGTSDFDACASDNEMESSPKALIQKRTSKKRCVSEVEDERADFKRRKVDEVPKRNLSKKLKTLKKTGSGVPKNSKGKASLRKRRKLTDSVLSSDICDETDTNCVNMSDCNMAIPVDANLNIVCMDSSNEVLGILDDKKKQEEMDKLLALKLSKEFEIEAKLGLAAFRFKGSDNEYKLRRHPRSKPKKFEKIFDT